MFKYFFVIYPQQQVRDADLDDGHRDKCVQLLDDFKIHGVNGTRKLYICLKR